MKHHRSGGCLHFIQRDLRDSRAQVLPEYDTDEEETGEAEDGMLAQFTKVTRNKSRWKLHLKAVVLNVGGRDYLAKKGMGDLTFD